jgi:chitodextrinase
MNSMRRSLVLATALMAMPMAAEAQVMRVATSPAGPGLHVVAAWPPQAMVLRYNLYRKTAGQAGFTAAPLNTSPLERMSGCAAIKAVIPPGSEEWVLLAKGLADGPVDDFDPCQISTLAAGSAQEAKLLFLARSRWKIAIVSGLAFDDQTVANGAAYQYELRSVNALGTETGTLFTNVGVTAGAPVLPAAPGGVTATAGDSRVLVLFTTPPEAAGFAVYRSTNLGGPYSRVNDSTFLTKVKEDLEGKPLPAPSDGLLDVERWDANGQPATHLVNGVPIDGPANGTTYFYKVASLDLLLQQGPASGPTAGVTPADKTAPATPGGVSAKAIDSQNRLEIRWNKVEFDVDGHAESAPMKGYRLFRYDGENAPLSTGLQIGGLIPSPGPGTTYVTASDNSPDLRPPFGEKTYWYRVEAEDTSGNVSARSLAVGAHLKDITPPSPPKNVGAEGFDDFIRVKWSANTEPDLDGYQIYRSLCHNGVANPCDRPEQPRTGEKPSDAGASDQKGPVPCTGAYVLVGSVSFLTAQTMGSTVTFEDRTVPKGSPLCYSYWLKALDKAQNMSGAWPIPDPATEKTVCMRLRDKTPPDAAIISGLFARDRAVRVEWIGPPVQDIRAYHVYRGEKLAGPYKWVGGMTVEPPPTPSHVLTQPYTPPPLVGCDKIPVTTIDSMSMGFFLDATADPKTIYWYKVVGIDQSGNEAPLSAAVPVSTFTFSTSLPPSPVITSIAGSPGAPFGLVVRWTPAFDASKHRGFAVFRSDGQAGLYRQIGTLLSASEFQDNQVVRGVAYWYKVVALDLTGQVSQPSPAASGVLP